MADRELATIVVVCGDPGGANAVAPVIEALRAQKRVEVIALAYRQARDHWAKFGLEFQALEEDISRQAVLELLYQTKPALLLTGTSYNKVNLENSFIAAATMLRIPSLAVLDFWSNYAARFSDGGTRLNCMPNRIAIMDERARAEMLAEGFDPATLVVTGQPALDDLKQWRERFTDAQRAELRNRISVGENESLILFVSQPLADLYGDDVSSPSYLGFTERIVLERVVAALDEIATEEKQAMLLAILPHPRETTEWFARVRGRNIRVTVAGGEPRDWAMTADLVVGMNSMLLLEAAYLACVTVSLQPDLRATDPLPTNRWGITPVVYRPEEIKPLLKKFLLDETSRRSLREKMNALAPEDRATQRVVELAYQMIGLESNG